MSYDLAALITFTQTCNRLSCALPLTEAPRAVRGSNPHSKIFGTAEYLLLDVADIGEAQMLVVTQILLSSWWGIFTLHCIYILSSTRLEKIATSDPLHKFDIW